MVPWHSAPQLPLQLCISFLWLCHFLQALLLTQFPEETLTPLVCLWASSFPPACMALAFKSGKFFYLPGTSKGWRMVTRQRSSPLSSKSSHVSRHDKESAKMPMATHVVLADYTNCNCISRLRFVPFLADSHEVGNWHKTDVKKKNLQKPQSLFQTRREIYRYWKIKWPVLLTIPMFNIFYMYKGFISRVLQLPIVKMFYEEMDYVWNVYYYHCHYKQHTLRYIWLTII